jgi:hypothetical protein
MCFGLERIEEEVVVAYLKILSLRLPGDTEENNETIGKPTKISRKNLRNTGK